MRPRPGCMTYRYIGPGRNATALGPAGDFSANSLAFNVMVPETRFRSPGTPLSKITLPCRSVVLMFANGCQTNWPSDEVTSAIQALVVEISLGGSFQFFGKS